MFLHTLTCESICIMVNICVMLCALCNCMCIKCGEKGDHYDINAIVSVLIYTYFRILMKIYFN